MIPNIVIDEKYKGKRIEMLDKCEKRLKKLGMRDEEYIEEYICYAKKAVEEGLK